jgi:hypothetical protein
MKVFVSTTFANGAFEIYGRRMLETFHKHWPKDVMIYVFLDDDTLTKEVVKILGDRPRAIGTKDQVEIDFHNRNRAKDDPNNYRKQFDRFSHKYFALGATVQHLQDSLIEDSGYVIWLDADTETYKDISYDDIAKWMPDDEEVASYLGRKDWNHSECGFMGFNYKLCKSFIRHDMLSTMYLKENALKLDEWHDSFVFDYVRNGWEKAGNKFRNLTEGLDGVDIWKVSPLHEFMRHYKGPQAKMQAQQQQPQQLSGEHKIITRNCVKDEVIQDNVIQNLKIIDKWIKKCKPTKEKVVVCSGGPALDIRLAKKYYDEGYKIVAVKHALDRLLAADIIPWACILLDPREHVEAFVKNPDKRITYFVSSMTNPKVAMRLIENDCVVYGYHASVGAGELRFMPKGHVALQSGSATATRGLVVLEHLGYSNFILLGYDLCHFKKPNLEERLEDGNMKYVEITLDAQTWGGGVDRRTFWTEGQFLAQAQEIESMIQLLNYNIEAYGEGIVPWLLKHKELHKKWIKKVYGKIEKTELTAEIEYGKDAWSNIIKAFWLTVTAAKSLLKKR